MRAGVDGEFVVPEGDWERLLRGIGEKSECTGEIVLENVQWTVLVNDVKAGAALEECEGGRAFMDKVVADGPVAEVPHHGVVEGLPGEAEEDDVEGLAFVLRQDEGVVSGETGSAGEGGELEAEVIGIEAVAVD